MYRGRKFTKYSPGCNGKVEYGSALYCLPPGKYGLKHGGKAECSHGKTRQHRMPGTSCELHYLENHFGILALKCPRCTDNIQEETDHKVFVDELYTYISQDILFSSPRWGWHASITGAFTIRCWHCGFVFFRRTIWNPTRDYVEKAVQLRAWVNGTWPKAWNEGQKLGPVLDRMKPENVK